jgi:large subunit ribosomal protein L25
LTRKITIEVPVKIVGKSKGVMAGGDLRLNNRKLKVKALPKNLPDFVEADITPLNMGNICYKVPTPDFKIMHPDNTVICQVKISRAYESGSRGCKGKAPAKERKIIFFYKYQKHQFQHWCFFFAFCFF